MPLPVRDQLEYLPDTAGVYQFFDAHQNLLYVGKAKNIKKRVESYWQGKHHSPWIRSMLEEIITIKITEVNTELEALMLENSFIKTLRPKYNIQLRDDKTFPFVRISPDPFPTFTITRRIKNDNAKYLGPYFSATYLRSMLKLLQGLYGIKTAGEKSYENKSNVPVQIGLAARNLNDKESYNNSVELAIKFISSPQPQMERIMKQEMVKAANNEEFERAAILRDRLFSLEQLRESQSLFSTSGINRDFIGLSCSGRLISVYILFEREGKIVNHKHFLFESQGDYSEGETVASIIDYIYIRGLAIPQEIVVTAPPLEKEILENNLCMQTGRKIRIIIPQRGDLKTRLQTAVENAQYQLQLERTKKVRRDYGLSELTKILRLSTLPRRIEACDISNLGPTHIVGATIVFIDGKPAKGEYRKYKIETPHGQDDFASMRELVYRRVRNKNRPLPDLLLVDGGKGQLSAAMDALKLATISIPVVALAKKEELLYLHGRPEPITLPYHSDALLFLAAIRDEVHRFVIRFHRERRSKRLLSNRRT